MKKIIVLLFLLTIGIYAMAQNPTLIQGESAITYMAGSATAATTDSIEIGPSNAYLKINGEYDVSIQVVPLQYGTLTSDSVYCTLRVYFSNKDNDNDWSERAVMAAFDNAGTGVTHVNYIDRQTMDNATVAAATGNLWNFYDVLSKRIKIYIARPKTTDSVAYKAIYTLKLNQAQRR